MEATSEAAVRVEGLGKDYGGRAVVDDVAFAVAPGEVFGLIGPNGSGKTTTVECLQGLRRPDRGRVRVLGLDPVAERARLRPRIGAQLQESALPERIRVEEALALFSALARRPRDWRPLLSDWGLEAVRRRPFGSLSGGQAQRLFVALALVSDPEVVFLDEMTTGLDPAARRTAWELVERVRDAGTTVLLVTHVMEEAERLCDRVGVLNDGRLVALGTPAELAAAAGGTRVRFTTPVSDLGFLDGVPGVRSVVRHGPHVTVEGDGPCSPCARPRWWRTASSPRTSGRRPRPGGRAAAPDGRGDRRRPDMRRAATALARIELRLFLREPLTAVFALLFPLMLLVVLAEVFGNAPSFDDDTGEPVFLGVGPIDYYVPAYVVMVVASVGLISLPVHLAGYRERGIMRRLRASGASAGAVVLAQIAVAACIAAAGGAVLLAAAGILYGTGVPEEPARALAGLALVLLQFTAIGVLLGVVLPGTRAAQGVGMTLFFGMFFIAGAGPPPEALSGTLQRVADLLPLTHAVRTVQDPWLGRPWDPVSLAVVVLTLAATAAAAALVLRRE